MGFRDPFEQSFLILHSKFVEAAGIRRDFSLLHFFVNGTGSSEMFFLSRFQHAESLNPNRVRTVLSRRLVERPFLLFQSNHRTE